MCILFLKHCYAIVRLRISCSLGASYCPYSSEGSTTCAVAFLGLVLFYIMNSEIIFYFVLPFQRKERLLPSQLRKQIDSIMLTSYGFLQPIHEICYFSGKWSLYFIHKFQKHFQDLI